jgi:peptidoglycan/xylan/chitin deacetylase (PgdA/CDA1 family)
MEGTKEKVPGGLPGAKAMNSLAKPFAIAFKGKGLSSLIKRLGSLFLGYGITSRRYTAVLMQFQELLKKYNCEATFPITISVLNRHPELIEKFHEQNIEFAVHGFRHVDHTMLSEDQLQAEFLLISDVLKKLGTPLAGFRSPYLRWDTNTRNVLREFDYLYDSSRAIAWPIDPKFNSEPYHRAQEFYGAVSAEINPSLPSIEDGLVVIPYSLPDDEALNERLLIDEPDQMVEIWLDILNKSYQREELFAVGLHPERFKQCERPLEEVLSAARNKNPGVWIARLDEIAKWWFDRSQAGVNISSEDDHITISIAHPTELAMLVKSLDPGLPSNPYNKNYQIVDSKEITLPKSPRPLIGLSQDSSQHLYDYLKQQGYLVERGNSNQEYSYYFDQKEFTAADGISIVHDIENSQNALVKLCRWPNGARSALAITGDIDAITYWDYLLRLIER